MCHFFEHECFFLTANCSALIFLAVPLAELFFCFFFFISIIAKEKASFFFLLTKPCI